MWTRVPTTVDGKAISGDWTITLNDRPVGRISHDSQGPGVGAWTWMMLDRGDAGGRAWTEEAALSAIKETVGNSSAEVA